MIDSFWWIFYNTINDVYNNDHYSLMIYSNGASFSYFNLSYIVLNIFSIIENKFIILLQWDMNI